MKNLASAVLALGAVLSLSACGSSESASEEATAENVEMPAEEALGELDPAATPVADAAATETAPASDAAASDAAPAASDAAAAAAAADAAKEPAKAE